MSQRDNLVLDEDGHLIDHTQWNTELAQTLADTIELKLNQDHLQILYVVREFYDVFEYAPNTRPLIKYLIKKLPDLEISNAYLQKKFNTGLVARHLSRIAGLPKPSNCL